MAEDLLLNSIRLLERLVLIDSGTENIAGVNAVQNVLSEEMTNLGFEVRIIPNPLGVNISGDLLVAELVGECDDWVTLVSHADTVFELDSGFSGFKVDQAGDYAIGPGVIDNKGGIVVALMALSLFLAKNPKRSYRMVVSPNEETGSTGFHEEFQSIGLSSKAILGFEPAFEDGAFVNRRQGNRWYDLQIVGREAHSGREHAYGVNAAHELACKISELMALTNYDNGTTVSVGRIEGGQDKFNIVCGEARAKIDLRYEDAKVGELVHQQVERILSTAFTESQADGMSPQCSFKVVDDCPPFKNNLKSDQVSAELQGFINAEEGGLCPPPKRGAAADTSYMAHSEAVVLDGLGVRGSGMHQNCERVHLSSLESRARACAKLLAHLDQLDF
ncbi:M20 family metallopeptidase [bacterium]|nr:M20 family metallopeptidase [bacterium]